MGKLQSTVHNEPTAFCINKVLLEHSLNSLFYGCFLAMKAKMSGSKKGKYINTQPTKPKIFIHLSGPLQIKPADTRITQRGEMAAD